MFIFNSSSVSQDNGVLIGEELLDSNTAGMDCIFVEGKTGIGEIIGLGNSALFVDVSDSDSFILTSVISTEAGEFTVMNFIKMSGPNTSKVGSNDDGIVFGEILGDVLTVRHQSSE